MKTIDERQTQKKTNSNNNKKSNKERKEQGGEGGLGGGVGVGRSYSERVRAKLFCCVFKLGFPQLICKPSLIFKANTELASF